MQYYTTSEQQKLTSQTSFPLPDAFVKQLEAGFWPKDINEHMCDTYLIVNKKPVSISLLSIDILNQQGFKYCCPDHSQNEDYAEYVVIGSDDDWDCLYLDRAGAIWYRNNFRYMPESIDDLPECAILKNPRFCKKIGNNFEEFSQYVFSYDYEDKKIKGMKDDQYNGLSMAKFKKIWPYKINI